MNDQDFVSLDPPAAQAVLRDITDEEEGQRLRQLYARSRGFLVDGTGWKGAPGRDPNVVRPFGLLGPAYRVHGLSRVAYWLQWASAGLGAFAYWFLPAAMNLERWLSLGVGLIASVLFGALVAITGDHSPPRPDAIAKTFD